MPVWLDANANAYSDGYTYAYSYTHCDRNHLAKRHPYGDTHFYTKTDAHAATPTHPAPSSHSTPSPEFLIPGDQSNQCNNLRCGCSCPGRKSAADASSINAVRISSARTTSPSSIRLC